MPTGLMLACITHNGPQLGQHRVFHYGVYKLKQQTLFCPTLSVMLAHHWPNQHFWLDA